MTGHMNATIAGKRPHLSGKLTKITNIHLFCSWLFKTDVVFSVLSFKSAYDNISYQI